MNAADLAQKQAADPAASVFVTANAGSGKTKVLVDRIARLLLEGSKPSAFLCITYTKAAAAEMQRRLFERLGAWCIADDAALSKALVELRGAGAPNHEELAKARALFAQALETPGGLKIQTIHAFCERLLGRFPLEAGVPPGFEIADDARAAELMMHARDTLAHDRGGAASFTRFAARLDSDRLQKLFARLVADRPALLAFIQQHGGLETAAVVTRARHGVTRTTGACRAAFSARVPWDKLEQAASILMGSSKNDQNVAGRIRAGRGAADVIEAYQDIFLTAKGEPYSPDRRVTRAIKDQHGWIDDLIGAETDILLATLDEMRAIERAEDTIAALELAQVLGAAYEAAKDRIGALDFEDLITHAHALLTRAAAAPWVLYKLDGGIDHILIDEGQDTSPGQWSLIAPLQEEFFAGEGARDKVRTVFAVGDPKQSIYSFQGADPDKFLAEAQHLERRTRLAGRTYRAPMLETSFRTVPEVLHAVDEVCAGKALARAAPESANVTHHLAHRAHEHGLVEVWPITLRPEKKQSEVWDAPLDVEPGVTAPAELAKAIAKRVRLWIDQRQAVWDKGVQRPMRPGDVLALVKKRGAVFRELIKAFKREGLPVAGADRMTLAEELAVEDCLALMRVALDPADDLSLACVLKGPWLNLIDDDADLFPLAHGRAKGVTLYQSMMANTAPRYDAARGFVAGIVARAGLDTFAFLSWALESRFADGRTGWALVLARLGAEARDPIEELLARALKPSTRGAPSLQRFVAEIESDAAQVKREMEAAGDRIRIMTVHGAKGLEAPVVILPDTTGGVGERAEAGLMLNEGEPVLSPSAKQDDAVSAAARAAYRAAALCEHWRLLYVAMTRARDRLIVCGVQHASGEAEHSWRAEVETALTRIGVRCETPFGEGWRLGEEACVAAHDVSAIAAPAALPDWARAPVAGAGAAPALKPSGHKGAEAALFSPRGDQQKRFRRGRMIHGLLQRLPEIAPERRAEAAAGWLARQGADAAEAEAFAAEALSVLGDPAFAAVFGAGSRPEVPIVGSFESRPVRGVVDRLAVNADVLILDFKTDRPAPARPEDAPVAYVRQMALYRAVIGRIFPGKPVRCALLWTEAPRLVELPASMLDDALAALVAG